MVLEYIHPHLKILKNWTQEIARVKYEIWVQGGPYIDYQQLFVPTSPYPLGDNERLQEVLPRGAMLQLIVTTPAARELSIHACVGPDYSWAAEEITVPIASHASDTTINYVTTDIVYLGDVTVESSADGSSIALEIQRQFDMGFEPQMIVFLSLDAHRERCPQG